MPLPRGHVSLARALSKRGLASRAEAERLIRDGRVRVDGRLVRDPMAAVVPERIAVAIDGAAAASPSPRTILLHKPRGVLTTRHDPEGRRTVYDLVGGADRRLVPVGRLDQATTGLLLFTTDTRLAAWLTDPANAVPRVYVVTVRGRVSPEAAARLEAGWAVDGEPLRAAAAVLRKASGRESHLVVTLTEGRNREVRRLFADLGHEVTRLARVRFGGLELGSLAPGRWRDVAPDELAAAFPAFPRR
jgi:23S rRNA pseudouridine2605 synthase